MILSEDRQGHFAHVIIDGVWADDLVDFFDDDNALRIAKKAIIEFVKENDVIDDVVRKKLLSLQRRVAEGGSEWETLYKKYYEEEVKRRGQG